MCSVKEALHVEYFVHVMGILGSASMSGTELSVAPKAALSTRYGGASISVW
jgi:hypothetical protein